MAQTRDVQAALESYQAAKEYGFESSIMNRRIETFEILARKAERQGNFYEFVKKNIVVFFWSGLTVFVLVLILIVRFVIRRKRRKTKTG